MTDTMQWTLDVSRLAEMVRQEDNCCLRTGDHLNEIEKRWGRKRMKAATQEAGLTWSLARQRSWVSAKIQPGHPLRDTHLSYSHLRVLADTDDPTTWGMLAVNGNWPVARLKEELELAGVKKAQQNGAPCGNCERPMRDETEIVSVRIGKEKSLLLCRRACGVAYLQRQEETPTIFDLDEAFSL